MSKIEEIKTGETGETGEAGEAGTSLTSTTDVVKNQVGETLTEEKSNNLSEINEIILKGAVLSERKERYVSPGTKIYNFCLKLDEINLDIYAEPYPESSEKKLYILLKGKKEYISITSELYKSLISLYPIPCVYTNDNEGSIRGIWVDSKFK